jgi:uncharacterized Fe-S cluster protein YjdI
MTNKATREELLELEKNKEEIKSYTNGEITVFWKPELCIHSANCLIGLPEVFNTRKKPWINIHASGSKQIMKTVDTCPSRALIYIKKSPRPLTRKRKTSPKVKKFAKIQILKNGPALITGNFIIRGPDKKKIRVESPVAAICRCGESGKKPFCDGSHQKAGFRD